MLASTDVGVISKLISVGPTSNKGWRLRNFLVLSKPNSSTAFVTHAVRLILSSSETSCHSETFNTAATDDKKSTTLLVSHKTCCGSPSTPDFTRHRPNLKMMFIRCREQASMLWRSVKCSLSPSTLVMKAPTTFWMSSNCQIACMVSNTASRFSMLDRDITIAGILKHITDAAVIFRDVKWTHTNRCHTPCTSTVLRHWPIKSDASQQYCSKAATHISNANKSRS
mmetsp:Transcript_2453/g.7188  ORF Transcript_2453/g.7188 Transcript_2453/m.7188 type:complete len:225 (-) Transcript_2453:1220-1894(-)